MTSDERKLSVAKGHIREMNLGPFFLPFVPEQNVAVVKLVALST